MPKIKLVSANNSNYFQDNKIEKGTARPTSGTYTKGDIMINTGSDAARTPMWICIASGTPGSWSAVTVGAANNATTTSDGLMSKEDKVKLNGIANNANNYVHPGSGTNPHGTTKADVGLGHVNNWGDTSATNNSSTTTYATAAAVKAAMDKANEAFQSANNGKNTIATAIGSPVSASDTFTAMGTKIDTLTQTFKTNLDDKGISVESGDKIPQLIDKVKNLVGTGSVGIGDARVNLIEKFTPIGTTTVNGYGYGRPNYEWNQPRCWFAMNKKITRVEYSIPSSTVYTIELGNTTSAVKDPNRDIFYFMCGDILYSKSINDTSGTSGTTVATLSKSGYHLLINRAGTKLFVGTTDGHIICYDLTQKKELWSYSTGNTGNIYDFAVNINDLLAVNISAFVIRILNANTGAVIREQAPVTGQFLAWVLAPFSDKLAYTSYISSNDHDFRVTVNARTGEQLVYYDMGYVDLIRYDMEIDEYDDVYKTHQRLAMRLNVDLTDSNVTTPNVGYTCKFGMRDSYALHGPDSYTTTTAYPFDINKYSQEITMSHYLKK